MRKAILPVVVALALITTTHAGPNDVLYQGKFYRDATVQDITGEKVRIYSKDGKAEVPWSALPLALKKKHEAEYQQNKQKAERDKLRVQTPGADTFSLRVVRVMPSGVVAQPYAEYIDRSRVSSMSRIGGGGPDPVMSQRLANKLVFIENFPSGTEGQEAKITARRNESYTYTDAAGQSRTVEKWVFMRTER